MEPEPYGAACLTPPLAEVDPDLQRLIEWEEERQARRLILIPSESLAPRAVREALASVFTNVYAEGWPPLAMLQEDEAHLWDCSHQLAYYRRYADRRFYKGTDYVHFVEVLAQRRCAACFANSRVAAEDIFVNVQPLSGAAANLAAYQAFLREGDTLMGMDLFQGGHLTHGSELNLSGQRYRVVSYGVDPRTERLDYDRLRELALQHRPRLIVAGFTSYPWAPDWARFREIADACGAALMADIAHTAGLVAAGVHPSPVGFADVVTFTTHKTLCGPRAAAILTFDAETAQRVDQAVFPGLQGGPHVNQFAAMAVAFRLARTEPFRALQQRILENAQALAASLEQRGLRLAYGGTDTHLCLIDLRALETPTGEPLRGEVAVRLLDLAGIVANKNTLPGDESTALASGVRLGTPWVTQRGLGPPEMDRIAECIARIVTHIHPFHYAGMRGELPRGKIPLEVLEDVKREVAALAEQAMESPPARLSGYPHYVLSPEAEPPPGCGMLLLSGWRAQPFLQEVGTADLAGLQPGQTARTLLLDGQGRLLDAVSVRRLPRDERGRDRYLMRTHPPQHEAVKAWLRALSDGYVLFDPEDIQRKVIGPVGVVDLGLERGTDPAVQAEAERFRAEGEDPAPPVAGTPAPLLYQEGQAELFSLTKPYFIGQATLQETVLPLPSPPFQPPPAPAGPLKRTPLFEEHRRLGGKMAPFAGWEMPVWYSRVAEEHRAVRTAAGLFDVAHMGIVEITGEHATAFLDAVTTNFVWSLQDGQSQYTYLLDPDGHVLDDLILYRRTADCYLAVVNAANAEKDWAWLNAVNEGLTPIDHTHPHRRLPGRVRLRDLKDPASGEDQRVDLALQGPASRALLQALAPDQKARDALRRLRRTDHLEVELAGRKVIVARTGYTGEALGYELLVHPEEAAFLWQALLEKGQPQGMLPCGLAARDSTRIEAGLPLYGHELAGEYQINPHEAGFSAYVKFHKAFFIGRTASQRQAQQLHREIVRFRLEEAGARALRGGETVVNARGVCIGWVTSATLVEGVQMGMALVERGSVAPGAPVAIYPAPTGHGPTAKPPADLLPGDRVILPVRATVLPRFRISQPDS